MKKVIIVTYLGVILAILILILVSYLFHHQVSPTFTIQGMVTDIKTGIPVQGAKISDNQYAGGKQYAFSDSSGQYQYLTWPEEHLIQVEAKGYKTQQQILTTNPFGGNKQKIMDFSLEQQ